MNDPILYFEVIAVLTGILSVWLTRKENVILYPVGICSVSIWIYLCWIGDLFGQSIINLFFLLMNLYGWYNWQLKDDSQKLKIQIKNNNNSENLMVIIASIILSAIVFNSISKRRCELILCDFRVDHYRFKFHSHVVDGLEENRALVLMDYWGYHVYTSLYIQRLHTRRYSIYHIHFNILSRIYRMVKKNKNYLINNSILVERKSTINCEVLACNRP